MTNYIWALKSKDRRIVLTVEAPTKGDAREFFLEQRHGKRIPPTWMIQNRGRVVTPEERERIQKAMDAIGSVVEDEIPWVEGKLPEGPVYTVRVGLPEPGAQVCTDAFEQNARLMRSRCAWCGDISHHVMAVDEAVAHARAHALVCDKHPANIRAKALEAKLKEAEARLRIAPLPVEGATYSGPIAVGCILKREDGTLGRVTKVGRRKGQVTTRWFTDPPHESTSMPESLKAQVVAGPNEDDLDTVRDLLEESRLEVERLRHKLHVYQVKVQAIATGLKGALGGEE